MIEFNSPPHHPARIDRVAVFPVVAIVSIVPPLIVTAIDRCGRIVAVELPCQLIPMLAVARSDEEANERLFHPFIDALDMHSGDFMLAPLKSLSLKTKLSLLVGIFIIGLVGFGVISYATLNLVKVSGPLYQQIVRDKDLLADISPPPACLLETYLVARQMCDAHDANELAPLVERYQQLKADYRNRLQAWTERSLHPATRDVLLKESLPPAVEFLRIMDQDLIPAIKNGEREAASAIFTSRLSLQYAEHRDAIDNLVMRASQATSAYEAQVADLISMRSLFLFSTGVLVVVLGCAFAFYIIRLILHQMEKVIGTLNAVADGELSLQLEMPTKDEFGRLARAVNAMITSLGTSRRSLEASRQSLAEMNAQIAGILDAATQIAIIATDLNGLITVFNSGAENMLGYRADEMVGRQTPASLHLPNELSARGRQLEVELGRVVAGVEVLVAYPRLGKYDSSEWTYVRKDGSQLTVNLVVTAVRTESGEIIGFLGVAEDITARKQAEQQLIIARQQAEEAVRLKGDFLANMSHEIRTPMNGIIGMTELALETELAPVQREYIDTVKSSANSLLRIINDILDFSKLEAGKLELDPHPFRLRESLGDAVKTLAVRAHEKNLELVWHVQTGIPDNLVGDVGRLRQVLVNLVGNAIKFTEKGEVGVEVNMQSRTDSSVRLRFSVHDTGIGIPVEKQALVFEAFAQADTSSTRIYGGTGLGLSISRQIVRSMGGEIGVESQVGQGSIFYFTIELPQAIESAGNLHDISLEEIRVLVVDDNQTNRRILDEILRSWKMRPILVADGVAAIETIIKAERENRPIPLILTDCHMPHMDGFMFVEKLLELTDQSGSTIMMLTSGALQGSFERCKQLGISLTLLKPIKQSELHRAIVAALGCTKTKSPKPPTKTAANQSLPPLRILLAEDNLINQRVAVHTLQKLGHTVQVAANGQLALDALDSGSFDVVLMDVQMPVLDGLQATTALRQRELVTGRHQPVIAMTAHAMSGDRERCLQSGMDDYVTKPIDLDSLTSALRRVLDFRGEADLLKSRFVNDAKTSSKRPAFDLNAVRSQFEDELFSELSELFHSSTPEMLESLESAVKARDSGKISFVAHAFKGVLGNFNALPACDAAARLEAACRQDDLRNVDELHRELLLEVERLSAELNHELNHRSSQIDCV